MFNNKSVFTTIGERGYSAFQCGIHCGTWGKHPFVNELAGLAQAIWTAPIGAVLTTKVYNINKCLPPLTFTKAGDDLWTMTIQLEEPSHD